MKTIEVEVISKQDLDRPPWLEWIPDYELDETLLKITEAGLGYRVLGPVSWQRQLAHMENNPE